VVKSLFNVDPQTAGDAYTVNVGAPTIRDPERPFANRHAPSLRAIYDFADLERSFYMQSHGPVRQRDVAVVLSFAERWAKVDYIPIPTKREALVGRKDAHPASLKRKSGSE